MPASKTPGVCPTGRFPMVMVAVTELLAVSITSTEASCAGLPGAEHNSRPQVIEVTYALLPSGYLRPDAPPTTLGCLAAERDG
jgi:hypothetical protein